MQRTPIVREGLHWDDVRLFLALCRASTVGAAAAALGVDASTVSRRLAALEESLAATLFDRGRDGIAATAATEGLMPVAEEMEAVMHRFAHAAGGLEREVTGLVRVTCTPDVAAVAVAPVVGELLARHPGLRIEIDPGEAILDLTRREADVAVRTVRPARGDLVVTALAEARWILVASPELVVRLGALRRWTDAPWVGLGARMAGLGAARWFERHVGVEPVVRSDSLPVQAAVVGAGVGVALMPAPSAPHYGLAPVKLAARLRPAAAEWPVNQLYLVTHRALRRVPRVQAVWDHLLLRLGGRVAARAR
jgi:DNA-binding transcriptional LysR family regulator